MDNEDKLTLTVVGSGDAFGSGGRLNTCFHVRSSSGQFLIDCGATTLSGLKQLGIRVEEIDVILITHFHGDHYGGLPFFLLDYSRFEKANPLTIVSPPGCKERVQSLLNLLYPGSLVLDDLAVNFIEYHPNEVITINDLIVQTFPVIHVEAALPNAFRINVGNKIISYSGDTEWTPNLVELANEADLFICQCNYYQTSKKGHLDYQTLLKYLPLLSYKRIWLTHFDPEMLSNLQKVELEYAEDGKKITL